MSVQVTQTLDLGDGRVQVWGRNPGGQTAHVIVGRNLLDDGTAYTMLEIAAAKLDAKAGNLALQSTLDSEADT